MEIISQAETQVGRARSANGDAYGCFPDLELFVVADGIGGGAASRSASTLLVETLGRALREMRGGASRDAVQQMDLERILCEANQVLCRRRELGHAGSTVAIVQFGSAPSATVAHAGDSRVYRIRRGEIARLTEDHNLGADMVREGRLTIEQVMQLRDRRMLTRAVGLSEAIVAEVQPIEVQSGDVYLLSTNGLHDSLSDEDLLRGIVANLDDLDAACLQLLALASERGGRDDATALLLQCIDEETVASSPEVRSGRDKTGARVERGSVS